MSSFRPVDHLKLNSALQKAGTSAAGRILRLAAEAGLSREEIHSLTWAQVDFSAWIITLPERTVPVGAELVTFLLPLQEENTVPVVRARRDKTPLTPQTISHLARGALTEAGLADLRLTDLRGDFARGLFRAGQDWQAVSRVTGFGAAALRPLREEASTRAHRTAPPQVRPESLERLLEKEGASPAGLAVAFAWRAGLRLEEIAALKWEQIQEDGLHLEHEVIPLPAALRALLDGAERGDSFVISTRTGRPFDHARLSRLVRQALVKEGLDDLTLRDLRQLRGVDEDEAAVLHLAAGREGVTLRSVQEQLRLSDTAARRLLRRMTQQGKLTRVGLRYYGAGTVVPPAQQEAEILHYLQREGFAYRQDIARLLHIPASQCRPVLQRLVEAGKVKQEDQRYIALSNTK